MKKIKFYGRRKKNILFILKERFYSPSKTSYGLINSAGHVAEYLNKEGRYNCKIVSVVDSNSIDKEMFEFKPDMVVIEALWVPSDKLKDIIAIPRYRDVKFVIRVHSDIGYLSAETHAIKLINEYRNIKSPRLTVSFNDKDFTEVMQHSMDKEFVYLPNIIITKRQRKDKRSGWRDERDRVDIGCFGATRILKNQCFQALCAIKAADMLQKKLFFHVTPNLNVTNDPVLENLKQIFKDSDHNLVIHNWMPNDEFQKLIAKMDLGLQLSFSESFNTVAADVVNNNRVIIVSDAIDWMSDEFKTSTSSYEIATRKIVQVYLHRNHEHLHELMRNDLDRHNEEAVHLWKHFLKDQLNEY